MNLKLIAIGKTSESWLKQGIEVYTKRMVHYLPFEYIEIQDVKIAKGTGEAEVKRLEGLEVLKRIDSSAYLVILDEQGEGFTSKELANHLQKRMNAGIKTMVFLIGGPYGFSEALYARANEKMSLSKLTFSHQMVRVFTVEQLYRAMTILRNEPYHHK
jgi:23S rRNA (pseudouridine1915-N3)-methyltransferase